jgi:hypothetical protein
MNETRFTISLQGSKKFSVSDKQEPKPSQEDGKTRYQEPKPEPGTKPGIFLPYFLVE